MDRSKIILLVDDDKQYVQKMQEALEKVGYDVYTAENGEVALNMLQDVKPDLIILDIIMPKMGGLAFYDRITPPNSDPFFPVLIATVRDNLKELFQHLPVEGFMSKPFEPAELVKKVAEIFLRKIKAPAGPPRTALRDVLIIDDDIEVIKKISWAFIEKGCRVSAVMNVRDATQKVIAPELPDLILIKQGLAGYPEFTISYHLKGMQAGRNVVIVVFTQNIKSIDLDKEREIRSFIGEQNLLEYSDSDYFYKRCEWLVEHRPK